MSKNRSFIAFSILAVAGCSSASSSDTSAPRAEEGTLGAASSVSSPEAETSHQEWRRDMAKSVPTTGGCFTVSHPSTTWVQVPCGKAPDHPLIPAVPARGAVHPETVGSNSGDFFAQELGGAISSAEGAFPVLSGVTSANESFSLQLNTQAANTGVCAPNLQDPQPPYCQDQWQQFVYSDGLLFMQYWLIGMNAACPAGWGSFDNGGQADCFRNSTNVVQVPAFPLSQLGEVVLTGVAGKTTDSVTLAVGTTLYSVSQSSLLGLWDWWNQAEFNVFGNGGGSEVVFDPGATVLVRQLVDGLQPSTSTTCGSGSFTGETNSLSLVPSSCCALPGPAGIQFTESNVSGATASGCPGPNFCAVHRCPVFAHWEGAPYCECVGSLRHIE
jgi:hypothetical protein